MEKNNNNNTANDEFSCSSAKIGILRSKVDAVVAVVAMRNASYIIRSSKCYRNIGYLLNSHVASPILVVQRNFSDGNDRKEKCVRQPYEQTIDVGA